MGFKYLATHPGARQREVLRVRLRLPATIFLEDGTAERVSVEDMSSTGLSFLIDKGRQLPSAFAMDIRLKRFTRPLKLRLLTRNRSDSGAKERIGCSFGDMEDEDKKFITDFITRKLSPTSRIKMSLNAAFICSIDASLRLFVFAITTYFLGTEMSLGVESQPIVPHEAFFFLHAATAFLSFIMMGEAIYRKSRLSYRIGAIALLVSLAFLLAKDIYYIREGMLFSGPIFLKVIFGWQTAILCYALCSLVFGRGTAAMIDLTFRTMEEYRETSVEKRL